MADISAAAGGDVEGEGGSERRTPTCGGTAPSKEKGEVAHLYKCSRCKTARYCNCSEMCKNEDWEGEKKEVKKVAQ